MNIIELVRSVVQEFPKIGELVHIDYSTNKVQDFGLSPTGDTLVSEDILGNQIRNHTFILYATCQSLNDYDRLVNSGMLLELQMWLERHAEGDIEVEVGDNVLCGELKKLTCSNGMLYSIPDENNNGGVQYQLQITAKYAIEN